MPSYQYELLSGQDNDFLLWENPTLPMHVGGIQLFDAGPLKTQHGGIDFEAIKNLTRSVLHLIPRYRQKIEWIPGESRAVWVDDEHFNLDYHFRHTSLPRPGTDAQLKALTARLMEHPLDRSRPLWETWVVEGLEGECFATMNKIHHCMIDGASGVDLSQLLLSTTRERAVGEAPAFIPRPRPRPRELRQDARMRRLGTPLAAARNLYSFARSFEDPLGEVLRRAGSLRELVAWKAFPASDTPLNGSIGPHRVVEWTTMPLAHLKAVRRALGCTINDVVLATVTGALRRLMERRQVRPETLDFRVSAPVNVRTEQHRGAMGNHVSSWVLPLPLGEDDPLAQIRVLHERTEALKDSNQAAAVELVTNVLDWLSISTQALSVGTVNSIVTNVPGPPFPLYMLGAELKGMMPFAPLIENLGLVISVLSYNGQVAWGFNADYDRLPDLAEFRESIERSFHRLAVAAGVVLEPAQGALPETTGAQPLAASPDAREPVPAAGRSEGASERSLP